MVMQSLGMSVQCNCRSGTPLKQIPVVNKCGFYLNRDAKYWANKKGRAEAEYAAFLRDPHAVRGFHGSR